MPTQSACLLIYFYICCDVAFLPPCSSIFFDTFELDTFVFGYLCEVSKVFVFTQFYGEW